MWADTFGDETHMRCGDLIQAWKIIQGIDDVDRSTWFGMAADGDAVHRTRLAGDQNKVVKPRTKYKLRENFYSVQVVD